MVGCLHGWPDYWLVGWLIGVVAWSGRLVGCLVGCMIDWVCLSGLPADVAVVFIRFATCMCVVMIMHVMVVVAYFVFVTAIITTLPTMTSHVGVLVVSANCCCFLTFGKPRMHWVPRTVWV